jgi:hypothetical protein
MSIKRVTAGAIGGLTASNGLLMVLDAAGWFRRVPGVTDTGPYNPHFVQDVGLAFVVAGGGLLACAWRPRLWPAGLTGAAFLAAHAGLHLSALGHSRHAAFEIALIVAPALLGLWACIPLRKETTP